MSFEFVIPMQKDDLLRKSGVNQYVVDEVFPIRVLAQKLQDCKKQIKSEGPLMILSTFDTFFSVFVHFDNVEPGIKQDAWQLLIQMASLQSSVLFKVLEEGLDADNRQMHLNSLKMTGYLLCQFAQKFEGGATKLTNVVAVARGRKKSTKASSSSEVDNSIDWDNGREEVVKVFLQLLQLRINCLWSPPIVEEEFINQVSNMCYKMLENQSISKNKALRDSIFQLLGIMVKRFNHAIGCTLKMIQLLQQFEHLASPLAQAFGLFVNSFGVKAIVLDVMREIGRMDPKELARDSSGTRAYAAFLVELAQCVPEAVLPNISVVLDLLDGESYTMRNSILSAIGEMVVRILSRDDLDAKQKSTRDQFLDKLEDHLHDVNAFVRSRVQQIWLLIINEKALPLPRQYGLLQLVIGRLQDKSSHVRKNAVQLLTALIKMNQLATQMSPEELKVNYEKEKGKLESMIPSQSVAASAQSSGDAAGESFDQIWSSLEAEMKRVINREGNSKDDETEENNSQTSDGETIESLRSQLVEAVKEKSLRSAIGLFKRIQKFSDVNSEDETPDENDSEAHPEEVSDMEEGARPLSKEGTVIFNGIKKIFLSDNLCTSMLEAAAHLRESVEPDLNIVNPVSKQQILVQFLKDSLNFVTEVYKSVPVVSQLLFSKISSDVLEAIDFFVTGHEIGVGTSEHGIRKMLSLVWSKEQGIKEAVVAAYKRVYLSPNASNPRLQTVSIASALIRLTIGATFGDLKSLEELVQDFVRTEDLNSRVVQVLWEKFAMKIPQTTEAESRGALVLLGMVAGAEVETVMSNIDTLIKEGLGPRAENDFLLARDTCAAFGKLATKSKEDALQKPFRLNQDHELWQRLIHLLVSGMTREDKRNYIPFAEQGISLIYKLAEHPDVVCSELIRKQAAACCSAFANEEVAPKSSQPSNDETAQEDVVVATVACSSVVLSRFVFCCGHVAFNELIHLDVAIFSELKRRNTLMEEKQEKGKTQKNKPSAAVNLSASTAKVAKDNQNEATMEEEMGLAGAAAEDAEAEYIRRILETDVVTGSGSLLAVLQSFVISVCANQSKFKHPDIRAAATLALSKSMVVSSEFCENNLPLLFTILEKSPHPVVRANAIIALGDLTFRFPNLIEPWTAHVYSRLRDESIHVRKTTIMVLTHLILNDMIKVKGQISELAMCVIDENPQISTIAKQFFHKLSKKGNSIYNILPDVISRLSDQDIGVDEEQFRAILKFLMSFIEKEKQCESLVEKLCHRFRATRVECQWRDLAFCLSLLTYNEKSVRKLQENFLCFGDKLSEPSVYESFVAIINNAKKLAKPEAKTQIEELEQRIEQSHNKCVEENETSEKAIRAAATARSVRGKKIVQSKTRTAKKGGNSRPSDDESDGDFDDHVTSGTAKKLAAKKKPILDLSSDGDSDFDIPPPSTRPLRSNRQRVQSAENFLDDDDGESDPETHPSVIKKRAKSVSNPATAPTTRNRKGNK